MLKECVRKFKVTTFDIDFCRRATPKSILGYMEETATEHAIDLGFSYEESHKSGFFWILRSAKYEFKKLPMINDEIQVKTYFAGFSGLKTLRKFEFKLNNEIIGYGYNHWLMISDVEKKPYIDLGFTKKVNSIYPNGVNPFKLNRIRFNEEMIFSYQKKIMPNDIDMNYHVNNVKYAEFIFNAIPINILEQYDLISLHIDYLIECKLNDLVDIYYKIVDDKILVEGKKENLVMFKSLIEIKKKK